MYSFFCLLLFVSSVLGKCRYTNIVSYKKDVNVGDPCQNSGDFFCTGKDDQSYYYCDGISGRWTFNKCGNTQSCSTQGLDPYGCACKSFWP